VDTDHVKVAILLGQIV